MEAQRVFPLAVAIMLIVACTMHMIYDIYALYTYRPTASSVIRGWSRAWPMLPFMFGVLAGHLFWSTAD